MTIRHLKTFILVSELESISKAATELCIAQPSVSQTIKELESYYGTQLFIRSNKKLKLTDDGLTLLMKAKEVVNSFDEFEGLAKQIELSPKINIGATLTFGSMLLPSFIKELKKDIPNIDPYIYIDKAKGLEERILNGDLDFAITEGNYNHSKNIKTTIVAYDTLVCVSSPIYNVPNKISIKDINKYDILRREEGSASRVILDEELNKRGIRISHPRMESISNASIFAMLKEGHGIALMPKGLVKSYIENGTLKEIELDITLERKLSIIAHKNKIFTKIGKKAYNLCIKILKDKLLKLNDPINI